MDDIKKSLNFMSTELTKLTSKQEQLIGLFEEVKLLRLQINEKDFF